MSEHKIPKQAPETYTIEVDANDLMAIGAGLQELKNKVAAPILARLNAQLTAQIQSRQPAAGLTEAETAQEAAEVIQAAKAPKPKSLARA